ncbi:MAG: hypothetical protein WD016_11215 [Balneolaceae bacterium]
MEKISQKDIDWLLNLNTNQGGKTLSSTQKKKRFVLRLLATVLLILGLIVLPFFLLIRTSIFLNINFGFNGWLALIFGIVATILLLLFYLLILFRKVENKRVFLRFSLAGVSALVLGFCIFGAFYLSSVNAKSDEVREVYRSLHPILRVAVATTTLADGGLVITDIQRIPEDYNEMGLSVNAQSLHYVQQSGYVHAIDLRTHGRWEVRNFLLRTSLEMMGFQTLRHVGTADHLHVALPLHKK